MKVLIIFMTLFSQCGNAFCRVLRYEELAMNPNSTAQELLKFLRLSATPEIYEFLHTHTNNDIGGVSSTFRVSREVPFRWKNVLQYEYVEEVQVNPHTPLVLHMSLGDCDHFPSGGPLACLLYLLNKKIYIDSYLP